MIVLLLFDCVNTKKGKYYDQEKRERQREKESKKHKKETRKESKLERKK